MQLRFHTTAITLLAVISLAGLLAVHAPCQAGTQEIRIAGSSTLAPIIERLARQYRAYHPEVQFVLADGGSAEGIAAVGSGRVQIGLASRALKDRELRDYPDLMPVRIGTDGIALVVHAENRVSEITTRKVKEVYSGQIANWEALGGQAAPIVLMAPDEKHGTFDAFCTLFELDAKPKANTNVGKKLMFKQRGSDQYSACETCRSE